MTEEVTLQPTSGSEWRKPREEGFDITLPSGNVARLRPVALHALLEAGKIPTPLVNLAAEVIWTSESSQMNRLVKDTNGEITAAELQNIQKNVPEWLPLAHIVCEASFVSPRIVDKPEGDDEISLADLEINDITWVWRLANKGAALLRGFRDRQARDVADVHDLHGAGDSAEQDGED